jgi:nucleoside-diphosphate-sugar epimerase
MKCLVTGGAGFIGSHIVEALVKKNHDVIVLDNFRLGREKNLFPVMDKIQLVEGDIRDEKLVLKLTKDVDFIFHQAAASSSPMFMQNLREALSINIDGFATLLNVARENGAKRVVHASTSSIYGNNPLPLREDMKLTPPNFYSVSKLACENLAKVFSNEYGVQTVGFRYMSVYGPREESKGIYANLASQFLWAIIKNERPVIYGDGSQTRDFVFVKDVVKANLLAMDMSKKISGEVINVGTGKATSLNELVSILNKILGKNLKPKYTKLKVKSYIRGQQADLTKAKKLLGYAPKYTLEEGIREIIGEK